LRAVFDTNVLISAFAAEGLCSKLLERANKHDFMLYVSPFILEEFKRTLKIKIALSKREIKEALFILKEVVNIVDPNKQGIIVKNVCRDRDDDNILAAASACRADYLITGDRDLLELNKYRKTKIFKPRDFELLFQ
jgi:uncharacterized protein